MSRYNRVLTSYWLISREWEGRIRELGLYVQTCEHRTGEGLYRLPLAYAAADLGWTVAVVERQMANLTSTEFVKYDPQAEVVLLPFALEIQAPTTKNQIEGALRRLRALPNTPLLMDLYFHANAHSNGLATSMRMEWPGLFESDNGFHSDGLRARSAEDALARRPTPHAEKSG